MAQLLFDMGIRLDLNGQVSDAARFVVGEDLVSVLMPAMRHWHLACTDPDRTRGMKCSRIRCF